MTRRPSRSVLVVLALAGFVPAAARAQSGGGYDLSWNTLDGGGGVSLGGAYVLSGTTGQPDAALVSGGSYQLRGGFWLAGAGIVAVEEPPPGGTPDVAPPAFRLHPVRPNPAAGPLTLVFDLPADARVDVEVFALRGERVRSLLAAERPAGRHQVRWDGTDETGRPVPDGVYFARVRSGGARAVARLVVAR